MVVIRIITILGLLGLTLAGREVTDSEEDVSLKVVNDEELLEFLEDVPQELIVLDVSVEPSNILREFSRKPPNYKEYITMDRHSHSTGIKCHNRKTFMLDACNSCYCVSRSFYMCNFIDCTSKKQNSEEDSGIIPHQQKLYTEGPKCENDTWFNKNGDENCKNCYCDGGGYRIYCYAECHDGCEVGTQFSEGTSSYCRTCECNNRQSMDCKKETGACYHFVSIDHRCRTGESISFKPAGTNCTICICEELKTFCTTDLICALEEKYEKLEPMD